MGGQVTGRTVGSSKSKSRRMVAALAVVCVIAWAFMALLIVLQDRMIDAQGDLIHVLFRENVQQAKLKAVAQQNGRAAAPKSSAKRPSSSVSPQTDKDVAPEMAGKSSTQSPLSQVPLSQDSSSQAPSSQVKPKSGDKSGRSSRKMRSPFSRPPAEITDPSDQRRVSISI